MASFATPAEWTTPAISLAQSASCTASQSCMLAVSQIICTVTAAADANERDTSLEDLPSNRVHVAPCDCKWRAATCPSAPTPPVTIQHSFVTSK